MNLHDLKGMLLWKRQKEEGFDLCNLKDILMKELEKKETIPKPWGWEKILVETKNYRIKLLHINAECRLSKQFHKEKEETLIGIKPRGFDIIHVPPGTIHRPSAGLSDQELIEISHGTDKDIIRLEDDYGRES